MTVQSTNPADKQESLVARALREAFYAGLVSLGMFSLYVGLKTDQNMLNELVLVPRWGLLAIFVLLAMVGRFLVQGQAFPIKDDGHGDPPRELRSFPPRPSGRSRG